MGSKGGIGVSIQCLNARALWEFQEPPSQWGGCIGRRAFGYPQIPPPAHRVRQTRVQILVSQLNGHVTLFIFSAASTMKLGSSGLPHKCGALEPTKRCHLFVNLRAQRRYKRRFYSLTRPLWSAWGYTRQDLNPAGEAPHPSLLSK